MIKNFFVRAINSFMYAIGITTMVYFVISTFFGAQFMLPEYTGRFSSDSKAVVVQLVLIGCMSAAIGGGSVIMEIERLSLVAQSIIYFVVASPVWIFVGCYCWSMHKYKQSFVTTMASYIVSYIVCWIIQYRLCKKNIEAINKKLEEESL